jgi:hypothetical protein
MNNQKNPKALPRIKKYIKNEKWSIRHLTSPNLCGRGDPVYKSPKGS